MSNRRLTNDDLRYVAAKLTGIIERARDTVPQPLPDSSAYNVYKQLLPPPVLRSVEAIGFHEKWGGLLETTYRSMLSVTPPLTDLSSLEVRPIYLSFRFQNNCVAVPQRGFNDAPSAWEDSPIYNEMTEFAVQANNMRKRIAKAVHAVDHLRNHLKTPGQVLRVWPELRAYLDDEQVKAADAQQRRSRLPGSFDRDGFMEIKDDATNLLALGSLVSSTPPTDRIWATR